MTPEERREKDKLRQRRRRSRQYNDAPKPEWIRIRIDDPPAWRAIMNLGAGYSLTAATQAHIDEEVRQYKRELLEAQWETLSYMRTGHIERTPPSVDHYLVKARQTPRRVTVTPSVAPLTAKRAENWHFSKQNPIHFA